ncbi:ArsR/SmtB family transcription factor [Microlunatus soli]|uniref:DNA-binding transcriptional regulator, ArsR family n=1 Tax=Microlunatus soli TaxID=630515 RepID=A0A1H1MZK8_9ACTN|nr:helix-turn-helix domain-containing protein [Microlunatus soli]SDR92176.1 DNA-binding transcriptional regulator, ArsR family [Microlunatus soli]
MAKYSLEEIRQLAGALAADSRLLIIDRLRSGPATSTELAASAGIGLPAVQKQLAVLQRVGLIASTKQGRVVIHRLQPERMDVLADWIRTRTSFWRNSFATLESALDTATKGH